MSINITDQRKTCHPADCSIQTVRDDPCHVDHRMGMSRYRFCLLDKFGCRRSVVEFIVAPGLAKLSGLSFICAHDRPAEAAYVVNQGLAEFLAHGMDQHVDCVALHFPPPAVDPVF